MKQLTDKQLEQLININQNFLTKCKDYLPKIVSSMAHEPRAILVCDPQGYIIDIAGRALNIQKLFEQGLKLGTSLSYESIGNNAVAQAIRTKKLSIVVTSDNDSKVLKPWISIAMPIILEGEIKGIICILKVTKKEAQAVKIMGCKLIIQLISDYLTVLLQEEQKQNMDKTKFFGRLILNNEYNLTQREIEILYNLKIHGKINELPNYLHISPNTVKTHLKNIYSKMNVQSKTQCLQALDNYLAKN